MVRVLIMARVASLEREPAAQALLQHPSALLFPDGNAASEANAALAFARRMEQMCWFRLK